MTTRRRRFDSNDSGDRYWSEPGTRYRREYDEGHRGRQEYDDYDYDRRVSNRYNEDFYDDDYGDYEPRNTGRYRNIGEYDDEDYDTNDYYEDEGGERRNYDDYDRQGDQPDRHSRRGFGSMSRERIRELGRRGGQAASRNRNYEDDYDRYDDRGMYGRSSGMRRDRMGRFTSSSASGDSGNGRRGPSYSRSGSSQTRSSDRSANSPGRSGSGRSSGNPRSKSVSQRTGSPGRSSGSKRSR